MDWYILYWSEMVRKKVWYMDSGGMCRRYNRGSHFRKWSICENKANIMPEPLWINGMCGSNPHLSIRHTKGRIAQQYQFRREPWLCVLSQYVPEINVGNINQCVVCGGGICRHKEASEILYRITNDIRSMKISWLALVKRQAKSCTCWVKISARTFRRTAICGNSFTYSQKFWRRFQWRETLIRTRYGVRNGRFDSCTPESGACWDSTHFHYASRSLRYRGAAFKEIFMPEENRCCGNCAYHDDWTWACFNPEADDRADFTDDSYVCDCWEDKYVKEVSEV